MENKEKKSVLNKVLDQTRREFLFNASYGIGAVAMGSMLGCNAPAKKKSVFSANPLEPLAPHFAPKAKNVIYMHMAGAPSQLELFDYKPLLAKLDGQDCPQSFLEGKRFAFIKGVPKMMGSQATFKQYGQSGAFVSHHLPHFSEMVDDVCFLKAMHTNEFNHAPAQLFMQTGSPRLGRPSIGSWLTYGLGTENENLPGFIVLNSGFGLPDAGKSIWGSGFLPSVYQGVHCRSEGDPVLYVSDPKGMDRGLKGDLIHSINDLNENHYEKVQDPEIKARIAQYEMAFKMQISVPEVMNINDEPKHIHLMYGTEPGKSSFANNCLLARRLVEKGVRFVQLYDRGWDTHGTGIGDALNGGFKDLCKKIDQPIAALLKDLKQRGMLEETLVIWGGEFGRTPMRQSLQGGDSMAKGRDHHSEAFTMWMAGGGIKPGMTYGETDELGYYGVKNKVHVHDLQATILNQMGLDHEKLTYNFQGRDFRLTDVHGRVVKEILV